jgi:hypothetical protein
MGAGFNLKTRAIDCNGQLITAKLNQVFKTPGTRKFKDAQDNNTFGTIQNVQDNWKDLLIAYLRAGVDVGDEFPAWVEYLQRLGAGATGTQGPQSIYDIAQVRYNALTANGGTGIGVDTSTGPSGGPVHTTPNTIVSPCPP